MDIFFRSEFRTTRILPGLAWLAITRVSCVALSFIPIRFCRYMVGWAEIKRKSSSDFGVLTDDDVNSVLILLVTAVILLLLLLFHGIVVVESYTSGFIETDKSCRILMIN